MTSNLIIDGNYLLNKIVFRLHSINSIGDLHDALVNNIIDYRKMYSFSGVYVTCDSREGYWRKRLYPEYKGTRKKSTEIDWKFVYETYNVVKETLASKGMYVMEYKGLEGDDWITYLVERTNQKGWTSAIVASDGDLTQLLKYNLNPSYMNFMFSENAANKKMYLPFNYSLLIEQLKDNNGDIFNLNSNHDFIQLIHDLGLKNEKIEIDTTEVLIKKIISGDDGDNIKSVFAKEMKNGKLRGIGKDGAQKLYDKYLAEFGAFNLSNDEYIENMIDLICEDRKVSFKDNVDAIKKKWEFNTKLMRLDLETFPSPVVKKMEEIYEQKIAARAILG